MQPQVIPPSGIVSTMITLTASFKRAYLYYTEKAIQATQSDPTNEGGNGQGRPQPSRLPEPRDPVPQEAYKPTRNHAGFAGSEVIRFVVDGEEGIRLSEALEANGVGFEGRDDRSLFQGDRLQIILRLHVRRFT